MRTVCAILKFPVVEVAALGFLEAGRKGTVLVGCYGGGEEGDGGKEDRGAHSGGIGVGMNFKKGFGRERLMVQLMVQLMVYGWRRDNGEMFIYMELVDGITLEQAWPDMDLEKKLDICKQLRPMLEDLRGLQQDPSDTFIGMSFQPPLPVLLSNIARIGSINRHPLHDVFFDFRQPAGPFQCSTSFYDWFSQIDSPRPYDPEAPIHPMRPGLPNDPSIVFTHADLHRSNIMVTKLDSEPPWILAIIDWHQSGWYPAAWEFFKTGMTCRGQDKWEYEYIFEFLQSHQGTVNWSYFVNCLGI